MTDWMALSDRQDPRPEAVARLRSGLFVLEFKLPLTDPVVLLQVQSDAGTFAIFFDPVAGVSVLQRQDGAVRRHRLKGALTPLLQGTARVSFSFDMVMQVWALRAEVLGAGAALTAKGTGPMDLPWADLQALCNRDEGTLRHASVLWFGLTQATDLPARAPWIGLNTSIDTSRGPVRAGLLQPGDMIATLDDGFQPLLSLSHRSLPSRGSFAPVVLRAPYFGMTEDILVSSDQLILISGASVEYLYGVEEALISAASLCDGRVAVKDERRAMTNSVALIMQHAYAITADGCCMMSAFDAQDRLPRLALADYEALPLLTLLGRTALRQVA